MFRFDRKRAAAALAALLLLALPFAPAGAFAHGEAEENADILRLHVLANSDSAEDQRVKLLVRDAILTLLPASASAAEAKAYLMAQGGAVLEAAERVLRENGFAYGAQLMLGRFDFPDRSYEGAFFPAGEYDALRVVLGRGSGQNWWCVLFPPLCIVGGDAEEAAGEGVVFESSLLRFFRARRDAK